MIYKIFTVFDSKVGAYMQPFFARSTGEAIRMFSQACADPQSQFSKYPGDFTLFEVGVFDDQKAAFVLKEALVNLGLAVEFIKQNVDHSQAQMFPQGNAN